ncbi:MAG: hypothetical protein P8M25_02275, partial [Paracoccaceae bacterium]|nr:hypothetical protein [Paracoccaceae bacterium]
AKKILFLGIVIFHSHSMSNTLLNPLFKGFSEKFVSTLYKRYFILHPFLFEYTYNLGVSYKVCTKEITQYIGHRLSVSEDKMLLWSNWFFWFSLEIKVKKKTQSYLINCEPIVSATSISLLNRQTEQSQCTCPKHYLMAIDWR